MSFTPFQRLVAQLTLEAIADLGFTLGGGQALHAHGYGDRLSLDLDFYVTGFDQELFDRAETATLAALRASGYTVQVGHSDTWPPTSPDGQPNCENKTSTFLADDLRITSLVRAASICAGYSDRAFG